MVTKRQIMVFSRETDEVVHCLDVTDKTESASHQIIRGISINLDETRYYVKLITTHDVG